MNMKVDDFMSFIADIFSGGIQGGKRTEMCNFLTDPKYKNKEVQMLIDLAKKDGLDPNSYDLVALRNTTIDFSQNMRQWSYQYCTEFGFYQMPNTVYRTRSALLTDKYFQFLCFEMFTENIPYNSPDTVTSNNWFHGLDITGSNILFFTARDDPWKYAGMMELQHPEGSQKNMVAHHINCVDCSHCVDLQGVTKDSKHELKVARNVAYKTITGWLYPEEENVTFLQE